MASGFFRIKKSKKNITSIYYRFKQGAKFDYELSTRIQIPGNRWSRSKQEILATEEVDYILLNKKLRELNNYVIKEFENSKVDGIIIDKRWLKQKMNFILNHESDIEKEKIYLISYIDEFIDESKSKINRNGKTVSKKTRQRYISTKNKILEFEKYTNKKLKLKDIDLSFHEDFISYLRRELFLNNNTIGRYINQIKNFLRSAKSKGIVVNLDFESKDFYSPSNKTIDTYLNDDEIDKIYKHTLEKEYLDNAKDWFIIGLRTGLRVSDLLNLKKQNIEDGFINWTTKKTEYPVIIPIHHQVKEILKKRQGEFPRKISDQKFNDYVKLVTKEAGITDIIEGAKKVKVENKDDKTGKVIKTFYRKVRGKYPKDELISSHTCRRSFATNLYGKIDSLTIMKITGHQTEKEFLKYIKITPKEYAVKLKEFWKRTTVD